MQQILLKEKTIYILFEFETIKHFSDALLHLHKYICIEFTIQEYGGASVKREVTQKAFIIYYIVCKGNCILPENLLSRPKVLNYQIVVLVLFQIY